MAATLEGAFKIRDQASAKLIAMRVEAERTDSAFERLGHRMDSVGSSRQMRQMSDTSRTVRTLGIDAGNAEKRVGNLDTRMKNADRSAGGFGARLKMLRTGITGFAGDLFKIARPAGMLVGFSTLIGLAGQGVGALVGTLITAAPRMLDLGAASAAAIPAVVGLVGGVKELTAAGKLLGQAMQGGAAGARAIREGGPALGQLVRHLRSIRGELRGIKQAGEAPIFRGINSAVGLVSQNRTRLRQISGTIGNATGSAIRTVAQGTLGNRGFMQDIGKLAGAGGGVIRSLGHDLVNVAHGFATIGVAARPLTQWLSKTVQGWTANWAASMKVKAGNGQLAQTFDRAKTALQGTFHFIHNVWIALRQLGRDARPAGEQLYHWLSLISDRWATIGTNTALNTRLTREFFGMEKNFEKLGNLVGTISKAVFNMGGGQGLGKVADGINGLIPAAAKFFTTMADTFGPPMVTLLTTFSQTLGLLTQGTDSPLVTILNTTNNILKAFNGLLRAVEPLRGVIGHVFEAALLLRFLTRLKLVSVGWDNVAASATRAGIAERDAQALGGGSFGIRPGPIFGGLGRRGVGRAAAARAGVGFVGTAEGEVTAVGGGALAGGRLAALGGGLRAGAAGAGRIFLPLTAILGAFGALSAQRSGSFGHQAAQTTFGAVQGATGGLAGAALNHLGIGTGALDTPDQVTQKLVSESQKLTSADLRRADAGTTGITRLNREVDVLQVTMQGFAHDQTDSARAYRAQLQQEIDQRKLLVGQMKAEQAQRESQRADQIAQSFQRIYQTTPGSDATKRAAVERAGIALISRQQSKTMRQTTANDLLTPLHGAARNTLGRQLAPIVGGVYGGGLVEIGGMAERQRIKGAATLPNTAADEKVYLDRLTANVIASGYTSAQARAWVAAWVASDFKTNVIPPGAVSVTAKQRAAAELAKKKRDHQLVPVTAQQIAAARNQGSSTSADIIAAGNASPLAPAISAVTSIASAFGGDPMQQFAGTAIITGQQAVLVSQAARAMSAQGWSLSQIEGQFQRWHPKWARHDIDIIVANALKNRGRHASGGRLGGSGLQDSVPVPGGMAAPGELVVNRHTERKVNYMLAGHGTSLEGMVDGETTPHSAYARGGRTGYARGGRLSVQPGLDVKDVNSTLMSDISGLAGSGHNVVITSGYRTVAHQAQLWDRYVRSGFNNAYIAARPGQSAHNFGLAVDADIDGAPAAFIGPATLSRFGLVAPVAHDPVHVELLNDSPQLLGLSVARARAAGQHPVVPSNKPTKSGRIAVTGGTGTTTTVPDSTAATRRRIALQLAQPYSISRVLSSASGGNLGLGGIGITGDQPDFYAAASAAVTKTATAAKTAGQPGSTNPSLGKGRVASGSFAAAVAAATGLNPAVVQAWVLAEGAYAPNGTGGFNYLNLRPYTGDPYSSVSSGGFEQFSNLANAETASIRRIRQPFASGILGSAGKGILQEFAAIAASAWDAGHYGGPGGPRLIEAYNSLASQKNARGGRMKWGGWHAKGVDAIYNTPTMLGVGEAGPERVTVTKPQKGGKGWGPTTVTFHNKFEIKGGDPVEVREQIDAALHQFADDLDRHFGTDVADGSGAY